MTLAQKQSMEEVHNVTKGGFMSMYVDLGEGGSPTMYYCHFVKDTFKAVELTGNAYQVSFDLETDI